MPAQVDIVSVVVPKAFDTARKPASVRRGRCESFSRPHDDAGLPGADEGYGGQILEAEAGARRRGSVDPQLGHLEVLTEGVEQHGKELSALPLARLPAQLERPKTPTHHDLAPHSVVPVVEDENPLAGVIQGSIQP